MKHAGVLLASALVAVALAGCGGGEVEVPVELDGAEGGGVGDGGGGEPRIDSSSEQTFGASMERMFQSLAPEQRRAFQTAVGAINSDAMTESGITPGFSNPQNTPDLQKKMRQALQKMMKRMDGKTAAEILEEGEPLID